MSDIDDAIVKSRDWLLSQYDHTDRGWAERLGDEVSLLNTAEVVISLRTAGVSPREEVIAEAIQCIESRQEREPPEYGCWKRDSHPDVIRTSVALRALLAGARPISADSVRSAIDWLLACGGRDGLWGFDRDDSAKFMPSCFALLALTEAVRSGDKDSAEDVTARLHTFLRAFGREDGSFGEHELTSAHTVVAAILLQAAHAAGVIEGRTGEHRALTWLVEHPEDALRFVEERVLIGDDSYPYSYMMDALLVRALASSDEPDHRGRLLQDAMLRLNERVRPSGAAYGERAFSWSTANALDGFTAASTRFAEFPRRAPPPSRRIEARQVLALGFIVFVLAAGVALSLAGAEVVAMVPLFILAAAAGLLILRFITETTFAGIVEGSAKPSPGEDAAGGG